MACTFFNKHTWSTLLYALAVKIRFSLDAFNFTCIKLSKYSNVPDSEILSLQLFQAKYRIGNIPIIQYSIEY